ncbi:MAG TPA: prolyl aminopeptidase [Candidatus Kapabacteria bacterium]|nr:prolyl aminopeptidase [Candidatus Kapabacteria bacterium]
MYPEIEPFNSGHLKVSDIHTLYYEEVGNPNGQPAVVLHGGPGAGCSPDMRRFFDPKKYRIVLFDQRACGRSSPLAVLEENDTWNIVEDIEKLRKHLGIEKWLVFGGSWGSTLSLSYSEKYPERVTHLVLRGIFLSRDLDNDWLYQYGASEIYPDEWEKFSKGVTRKENESWTEAYYRVLTGSDKKAMLEAARCWSGWEWSIIKLVTTERPTEDQFAINFARIECHFIKNRCFLEEGQLLRDVHKIKHIPTTIVHGRYDVICAIKNAFDLKKELTNAKLVVCPRSGHSQFEEEISSALTAATDSYRA